MSKRDPWWWKIWSQWCCLGSTSPWHLNSQPRPHCHGDSSLSYRGPRHYLIIINLNHLSPDSPSSLWRYLKTSIGFWFPVGQRQTFFCVVLSPAPLLEPYLLPLPPSLCPASLSLLRTHLPSPASHVHLALSFHLLFPLLGTLLCALFT